MTNALRKFENYSKKEINKESEIIKYLYFNEEECFVRVLSKSKNLTKSYSISSLKNSDKLYQVAKRFGREDIFMSLNPFRTMESGANRNLFCINCIAVDVDYKKIKELKELDPVQIINLLELDFFDIKIPTPNLIEYGNQVRLIYKLHETVYIPKFRDNVKVLARRISEVFAKELKDFGAEKQNLESYFRFPGSINTKNDSSVRIFKYDESIEYTLRELQELWLDELPKWWKRKKGRNKTPKKVVKLHNVYSLNCNRLLDFEKIQQFLNANEMNDLRARLCFLYRNYVLVKLKYQNGELIADDYETAKDEMLKFNNQFNYPLRDNVIESATRVVNYRQYLYRNDTLINFLELDYEFCENLGLQSLFKVKTKEEVNKDYYKRNINKVKKINKEAYEKNIKNQGKVSKKEEIEILRKKIKTLKQEGFKNREISDQLNISVKSLERHITFMRKNGLL
ncbi:helix-turn-helix domain-containing protein [Clostridium perfringens]|uniref:DNA-binding response regulator n=1 Tax=Clostridium perfringens TaxID=1502 RepID=UPI002245BC18|nr:DNA-binding response regulator [Clostridium perfringens]MCX0405040.1 DNA-binding response regulator [Clostridium perfringens]